MIDMTVSVYQAKTEDCNIASANRPTEKVSTFECLERVCACIKMAKMNRITKGKYSHM